MASGPGGKVVTALALCGFVAAGCKQETPPPAESPDDPALLAQDGADTSASEADTEVLSSSLVSVTASGPTLSTEPIFFLPRACLTITNPSPTTRVFEFADCSGPHGLVHVTGKVTATTTSQANELDLQLVGTGLTMVRPAGTSTVDWSASAKVVVSPQDGLRTMTWSAQLSGVTLRGRTYTRSNQKTVTWKLGDSCYTLSGSSEGQVKNRDLKVVITNYERCSLSCPENGGSLSITDTATNKHVDILFDGTDTATLESANVKTTFPLLCAQ